MLTSRFKGRRGERVPDKPTDHFKIPMPHTLDAESIAYMTRSPEMELAEVMLGSKPAALGFWKGIPDGLVFQELHRVPGRYYKYAVARTVEQLQAVVSAYYLPITPDADRYLGICLGYSDKAIESYVAICQYKRRHVPKWKEFWWKIKSTAEKLGWKSVFYAFLERKNPVIRDLLRKEGF